MQVLISLGCVLLAFRMGYPYLIGLIGVQVVLMNLFVVKQMTLFGLDVTGGNVLYASIFLSTDLIAEHFGRRKAHRAVWFGFAVSAFFVVMIRLILTYEPNRWDFAHQSMASLYSLTPRIVFASMLAYLLSQHLDIRLFEFFGRLTRGKHLWLRNNFSTATSQLVDTIVFTLVAFLGVFPHLFGMILFTYIVKVVIAALDTPLMYLSKHPWFHAPGSIRRTWQKDEPVADEALSIL